VAAIFLNGIAGQRLRERSACIPRCRAASPPETIVARILEASIDGVEKAEWGDLFDDEKNTM
jgi:hypothetical protein